MEHSFVLDDVLENSSSMFTRLPTTQFYNVKFDLLQKEKNKTQDISNYHHHQSIVFVKSIVGFDGFLKRNTDV